MKTLTTLLTSFVLLTSCGNKNEISCSHAELTSDAPGCVCQLLAKKNTVKEKTKRSKNGLIMITQKISSIN